MRADIPARRRFDIEVKMLIFEPSEDNDRELISAFCNELSKNESVNLKELHSPHSHGSSELLNDIYLPPKTQQDSSTLNPC
jgi:hypothetical protein